MSAVLCARGVSVSFGGVHAVVDVHLDVPEGRMVGLIGPNGAGKTTFVDAITGFTRCRGSIELDGRELASAPPHERAARGMARTWQAAELFNDLTVAENLAVAAARPGPWELARQVLGRSMRRDARVDEVLGLLGLRAQADLMPDALTQGQRKLVGVARAMVAGPRILCLDEPAGGLDTNESQALGAHLRDIVDAGTAMLLIDHDMGLVLSTCDEVVVLEFGKVIARGTPSEIRRDPAVVAAYLGGAAEAGGRTGEPALDQVRAVGETA